MFICVLLYDWSFFVSYLKACTAMNVSALLSSAVFVHVCEASCPTDWVE